MGPQGGDTGGEQVELWWGAVTAGPDTVGGVKSVARGEVWSFGEEELLSDWVYLLLGGLKWLGKSAGLWHSC